MVLEPCEENFTMKKLEAPRSRAQLWRKPNKNKV